MNYVRALKKASEPSMEPDKKKRKHDHLIGWKKLAVGFAIINTDGASKGKPGISGAEGLIRNHHGDWIKGFLANLGNGSNMRAEAWAVFFGLDLAWKEGLRKVEVHSDSQVIIGMIKGRRCSRRFKPIMDAIWNMLNRNWIVKFTHVLREGNRCADLLANQGCNGPLGLRWLTHPQENLQNLLMQDILGVALPRACISF